MSANSNQLMYIYYVHFMHNQRFAKSTGGGGSDP